MTSDSRGVNVPAWDDGDWVDLPALAGDVDADVCVVGLGGSGLACVNELLALGKTVVGLDAGMVGGAAAGRNGGFLLAGNQSFYHDSVAELGRERARAIYLLTLDEIARLTREAPGVVRHTGSLRIAASQAERADCARQLEALQADGLDVEEYNGAEGVGLLLPHDCAFDPLARCRAFAFAAIEAGARLFERSRVVTISDGVVTTANGSSVRCESVIVAVDGNLEGLVPALGDRVRTTRLQMLGTAPLPELRFTRPVYSNYGYDYWQQLPDKRVVLGGCRDRFAEGEWTSDALPTDEVQHALEAMLRDDLHVSAAITHRWAASVSYTDEPLPVLARTGRNSWAIGAYNGTGNVIGSLYGRMVAQLAVTGASSLAEVFFGDARATSSGASTDRSGLPRVP